LSGKRKGHRARGASFGQPGAVPVDLLLASAQRLQRAGDVRGAEQTYRRVLERHPYDEHATQLLGAILAERHEIDAAIDLFESAAAHVGPTTLDTMGFYNNYANALRRAGRLRRAEEILSGLVAIAPGEWQPWHNYGQTLKDLERYDEAAAAMRRAVRLEPDFGPNHGVLGEVLHHLGRLHSAEASLRRAIALGSANDHTVWTVLGNNQRMLGHLDESLEMVTHALALAGGTPAAHSNVGVVLMQLGRFDESVEHFRQAIAAEPDNNGVQGYLGYALLAAGRLQEAFEPWERAIDGGPRGIERNVSVPRWTPEDSDARVLVYREQGIGDEIMLASLYPDLIAAAREVVIECDTRLVPLFARSFPGADVRAQTHDELRRETTNDFDRAIPAGSLIRWFRTSIDAFPDRRAFLAPDPERVAAWNERLAAIGPPPYVGISWRSKIQTAERRLEYTRLEEWAPVFANRDVTWINLQYDDCNRELRDAEKQFGVQIHGWDWVDLMNDFDEVAALTTALDLVVAPFNAVSMLSGALGVPTVAMGNRHGWAELGSGRMPWTPSIVVAARMPDEEWDEVLTTAAREVSAIAERCATRV
jgi:tetratricopeptide (TPR) repeat protein